MESLAFSSLSLTFPTSVQPVVINITSSVPFDDEQRVIVLEGTTVTINVTVRSEVMPEISWIFTNLDGISGTLNTSNMALYETTSITFLGEELYQVCKMLAYIICSCLHTVALLLLPVHVKVGVAQLASKDELLQYKMNFSKLTLEDLL